jgi:hypothetical protein
VYQYVKASLDEMEIKLTAETLDDPITRLNELYKANVLVENKPPLKWGDAAYKTDKLYVPRFNKHPADAKEGQVYFSIKDRHGYILTKKGWVHISRAPLMNISAYPKVNIDGKTFNIDELPEDLDDEKRRDHVQLLWYAGVYGFPDRIGKFSDSSLDKVKPAEILKNPDRYQADIIGQGVTFKVKEAKKLAADQALKYLQDRGIQK